MMQTFLVALDKTWIHHYTSEIKVQSKEWIPCGKPTPKKTKTIPSAGKLITTVFFGILME